MATHHRPPVIPEIAKAYQNDPRTALALAAMKAGSSTAPVAAGKYGYADGIARVLQGVTGGLMDKDAEAKYGDEEAKLLALRQQRGVDGLTGAGGVNGTNVAPNAAAVATALGAPAPSTPTPPQGGPGLPMAPVPTAAPPGPPMAPPGPAMVPPQGGGPNGRPPFGPTAVAAAPHPTSAPAYLAAPVAETVPDAPAPVARPVAPMAQGPTKSRMLNAAYRIMSDANPYESANGQDMYQSGLAEQTKLDESAAERKQRLDDMGYQTDLGTYATAQSQDREANVRSRENTVEHNRKLIDDYTARNFQYGVHKEDQAFEAHQKALDRSNAMAVAQTRAKISAGSSTELADDERAALSKAVGDGRIDLKGITKFQAKVVAQSLLDNPELNGIQLHARAVMAANPVAQRQAMTTAILPEVLSNVRDAGKKLKYNDAQFIGKMQQFSKGQLNDPDFTNYMTQRNDALLTVAQVMRGTGATDLSTKMEAEAASPTMSPAALDGWYKAQFTALMPRIRIAEKRGLVDPGTADMVTKEFGVSGGTAAPAKGKTGNALVDKYLP